MSADKIDTRQRVPCAKCGTPFPRRYETREYCFRCQKLERRFEDTPAEVDVSRVKESEYRR